MTMSAIKRYAVCVANDGYPVSLEIRKIYEVIPDAEAERLGQLRVIDESGSDYLFPREYFRAVELSEDALRALEKSNSTSAT